MRYALPILLLLILGAPAYAAASPWTPGQGEGYAKVWLKGLWGFGYVNGDRERLDYANYGELFVATYGHVGLTDRLTLVWQSDLVRLFALEERTAGRTRLHVAPGDPTLGLRLGAVQAGRFALSVEAGVQAPLAPSEPVQEVQQRQAPHAAVGQLVRGPGVVTIPVRVHAGWGGDGAYAAGTLGWETRFGGFDDRASVSLEAGMDFRGRWSGRLRVSGVFVTVRGDAARVESPSGQGNGVSYLGFAAEVENELRPGWFLGGVFEGGLGLLQRQTGGPVLSLALARVW
ncbi:MAG: hypothetical protein AAF447_12820 [Myxococcota bacterium]